MSDLTRYAHAQSRAARDPEFAEGFEEGYGELKMGARPRCGQRDLGDIAGTWQEDPEFDQAIAEQDQI